MTNTSDAPVLEVSCFLLLFIGGEQVGRSKGTWFMNLGPGETHEATFETPHAPCNEVEEYRYVVGACRLQGPGFDAKEACAARISPVSPIVVDLRN